jgi:hypothetical protein
MKPRMTILVFLLIAVAIVTSASVSVLRDAQRHAVVRPKQIAATQGIGRILTDPKFRQHLHELQLQHGFTTLAEPGIVASDIGRQNRPALAVSMSVTNQ